jgi:integrase
MATVFQTIDLTATLDKLERAKLTGEAAALAVKAREAWRGALDIGHQTPGAEGKRAAGKVRRESERLARQACEAGKVKAVFHKRWRYTYVAYAGPGAKGVRKTATGSTTQTETETTAGMMQAEQDKVREGIKDAPKLSDKVHMFADVVKKYMTWGKTQGNQRTGKPWSESHRCTKEARLAFWAGHLHTLDDVQLDRVELVLQELGQTGLPDRTQKARPLTGKTLAGYAGELSALTKWALDRDYLDRDPLRKLGCYAAEAQTKRRAATAEEIRAILAAASNPRERLLFEAAFFTGLRASELRRLTARHIACDVLRSGIHLAGVAKYDKRGLHPIPRPLAERLLEHGKALPDGAPLFDVDRHPYRPLDRAMKRAGVQKRTPEGRLDFHALRTTYITMMDHLGLSGKETQQLARHSSMSVTFDRYAQPSPERMKAAVDRLWEGTNTDTTGTQCKVAGS